MSYDEKVAVIISTFNRKEYLRRCIISILKQTVKPSRIIVVDGPSTDGTDVLIKTEFPFVYYIRLNSDLGGSAQFYIGMRLALDGGFDWLWIMDDDAEIVRSDALRMLLDMAQELKAKGLPVGAVAPLQLVNGRLPEFYTHSVFVGGLISREAVLKVGLPRHDFFIYNDDVEYLFRLLKAGFVVKIAPPLVEHGGWPTRIRACFNFLWKRVCLPILSCKKTYYLVRNGIIIFIDYKLANVLLGMLWRYIVGMFFLGVKLRDVHMPLCIVRGILEGFMKITGKRCN